MKKRKTRSKVKPRETASPCEKPEKEIDSDQIFRLIQNSRRIPPSYLVTRRRSSIFFSFARALGKVLAAWITRRRKKRSLYERLAKTVDEIASDPPELYEKLRAGKKSRTSKINRQTSDNK